MGATLPAPVEFDAIDARRRIRQGVEETAASRSFTASPVFCLGEPPDDHLRVQASPDWRGREVQFDEVDVNELVEREIDAPTSAPLTSREP